MPSVSEHTVTHSYRHRIAAGLTALYLMIIFSPLASFAMYSTHAVPVAIRECTGDCDLCGCSPESRLSHTCCCSKKRQQQAHEHKDDGGGTPDCCKKKPVEKKTIIACGCPCGSGKQALPSIGASSDVLPFHFREQFTLPHTNTAFTSPPHRLTSRHGEPPDPPPKLISFC